MRSLVVPVILVVVGLFFLMAGCNTYNSMVSADEEVAQAWGNVQTAYQRRADLIPNLVSTVKGAADFEKSTLEAVVNARAKATSMQVNAEDLTPEKLQQFQAAQGELSQALGRLLVSVERYPELKANQNFRDLQAQLEGTENRISTERRRYNQAVTAYNKKVRTFPNTLFAGLFGFDRKDQFEADATAQEAPQVNFE
jgi:LemA protein